MPRECGEIENAVSADISGDGQLSRETFVMR